jgi:hypothetical protein
MPVYKVKTKEEFADVAAKHLFNELISDIYEIDEQATECGFGEPDMLLTLLSQIGAQLAMYTSYMASGLYLAQGEPTKAVEIVDALLKDYKAALIQGVKTASVKVASFDAAEQSAKDATAEMLDRVLKKKRHDS